MKLSDKEPAVYRLCQKVFGVGKWEDGIVVAYGDTIYCYNDITVREDLIVHEKVHLEQQAKIGVDEWWNKYLVDSDFRKEQELKAYRKQVAYMKEVYPRLYRNALIKSICRDMVKMYGDAFQSEEEAYKLIV